MDKCFLTGWDYMKYEMLKRSHIEKKLNNILRMPITLVQAPEGCGKTTAIYEFLSNESDCDYVWMTVDGTKCDETLVWSDYKMKIVKLPALEDKNFCNLDMPKTEEEISSYYRNLDRVLERHCVFVLDGCQNLKSDFVKRSNDAIAASGLIKVHLVLIYDGVYEHLDSTEKESCFLVNQEDLSFSNREIKELSQKNGDVFSWEEVLLVEKYSKGCISAICCYIEQKKHFGIIKEILPLERLVQETVFDLLPLETQKLVVKFAPIHGFTYEQAAFLLDWKYDISMLENIIDEVPVLVNNVGGEIRIHPLLRAVLQKKMDKDELQKAEIMKKNAEWMQKQGEVLSAIDIYAKLGAYDEIFEIMRNGDNDLFLKTPNFLLDIFREIPAERLLEDVQVYIQHLLNIIAYGDYQVGIHLLEEMCSFVEEKGADNLAPEIAAKIAALNLLPYFSNAGTLKKIVEEKGEVLQRVSKKKLKKNVELIYTYPKILSIFYQKPGTYANCVQEVKELFDIWKEFFEEDNLGWIRQVEAEYSAETGLFEKARNVALENIKWAEEHKVYSVYIASSFVVMRCSLCLGEREICEEIVQKLTANTEINKTRELRKDVDIAVSYFYACIGKDNRMKDWISNLDFTNCNNAMQITGAIHVTCGLGLISKGKYLELQNLVEKMEHKNYKGKPCMDQIYKKCFAAIAAYHTEWNGEKKAERYMKEALELAKQDGLILLFAELARELLPILKQMGTDAYLEKVIDACESFERNRMLAFEPEDSFGLSKREREIMDLVSIGKKTEEIARGFDNPIEMIESELGMIYRKLGVRNRSAAVLVLAGMDVI